mgnify:CR=1 FL=1
MCLAIPGKIIEVDEEGNCVVDYVAERRGAKILMDGFGVGDYVIVSNKIASYLEHLQKF